MMMMMMMMMTDVVSCYVQLHGYGFTGDDQQPGLYRAVALNGVEIMNATYYTNAHAKGIYTYTVDSTNCSASDYGYFKTHIKVKASHKLINYIESLANG